uniref:CSON010148 protein n=1 Tax=Culicoides sonorensis TaxID=179676 RepID=A0A336K072_CULSO
MFYNLLRTSLNVISRSQSMRNHPVKVLSNYFVSTPTSAPFKVDKKLKPWNKRNEIDDTSFLLKNHDPDEFGTIGSAQVREIDELDEDDAREDEYLENPPNPMNKLGMRQYADMMKAHLKRNKLHEAIKVLEERMLKEDRVQPTNYIYNILIGGCARLGYDKKAFQLYSNMKQRQLKVTGATYTNLFNACANSPYPKQALIKAQELREKILEIGFILNTTNYHAMIKAFGRLGDIQTAFHLVDEMQTKKLPVRVETYNFLLQACVSDPELGFRHALIVWHKMHRRRMAVDYYSFNLMLRCVRDCGIGDVETTERLIQEIIELNKTNKKNKIEAPKKEIITIGETKIEEDNIVKVPVTVQTSEESTTGFNMPNLLAESPQLGNLLSISEIKRPEERLLLLGGLAGFLQEMDVHKVNPDIKTFTQLVDIIPSTLESEKKLLRAIKERGIKCDIDFFNILIKKRSLRSDYENARRVLTMIKTAKLKPDIVTYGVLALACESEADANTLLADMESKGIRINIEILGAMLRKAGHAKNFSYILHILNLIKENNLKLNPVLVRNVYNIKLMCSNMSKEGYAQENDRKFRDQLKKFKFELYDWMEHMGLKGLKFDEAMKKAKENPYKQFKEPTELKGYEPEKQVMRRKKKRNNEGFLKKIV